MSFGNAVTVSTKPRASSIDTVQALEPKQLLVELPQVPGSSASRANLIANPETF